MKDRVAIGQAVVPQCTPSWRKPIELTIDCLWADRGAKEKSVPEKGEFLFAGSNIEKPCVSVERFNRQVVNDDGTSYGAKPG